MSLPFRSELPLGARPSPSPALAARDGVVEGAGAAARLLRIDSASGAETEVTGFRGALANEIAGPYVLVQQPRAVEVYGP